MSRPLGPERQAVLIQRLFQHRRSTHGFPNSMNASSEPFRAHLKPGWLTPDTTSHIQQLFIQNGRDAWHMNGKLVNMEDDLPILEKFALLESS
ncbi:MAG: hypothetical protein R3B95_11905 [Nitrospirales bacterium]|nr:hypothetical protein [Nitrospirales bacterium]